MADETVLQSSPHSFEAIAASRRNWIDQVLRPWCQAASLSELRKVEAEWFDIAGRADANATLWTWAWERFPEIVHPELPGVHETHEVTVTLQDGTELRGFPNARKSLRGMLVIVGTDASGSMLTHEAVSIDVVQQVVRLPE